MTKRLYKSLFLITVLLAIGIWSASCSDDTRCFGVNLERTPCVSDNIIFIGQQEQLRCIQCTSDQREGEFGINFMPLPLAGANFERASFSFLNTDVFYFAEFSDCRTMNLLEASRNQLGRFERGPQVGTLEDIEAIQIDRLSLFINIPGVSEEEIFCNQCFDTNPPICGVIIN